MFRRDSQQCWQPTSSRRLLSDSRKHQWTQNSFEGIIPQKRRNRNEDKTTYVAYCIYDFIAVLLDRLVGRRCRSSIAFETKAGSDRYDSFRCGNRGGTDVIIDLVSSFVLHALTAVEV